jgi:hypothetical protein
MYLHKRAPQQFLWLVAHLMPEIHGENVYLAAQKFKAALQHTRHVSSLRIATAGVKEQRPDALEPHPAAPHSQ